ncbi:hypothetical protein Tco_1194171 [Tanacetum coccineum]
MPWARSDQRSYYSNILSRLDEPTQEILDVTAGGIFLYKSPNQAFQYLEDNVLFKLDWSTKSKNERHQRSVAFADGKEINEIRKNYNNLDVNHVSKNYDTPMCERHEANYIQSESYQNRNSHDSYCHQSHHDPNDSEKSLTELNNDVRNDLEHFKRCIRSMRTVHDKLFDRDDQSKTDLEKSITKFLDGQRVAKQTDRTDLPPPQAHTEHVNAIYTGSGKSDESTKTQKDPPPPIIVNNKIPKDKPIKASKKGYHVVETKEYPFFKHAQSEEVQELLSKLVQDVKIISDELSEYINTPAWNRPLVYCDNDDDEDYTIAITPESPTKEPVNSLSLGDEHLDTIPATESDEFIKSSVENLVPTPIEFEDFSDDECDLPPYDDSSKNHDFTFSNPLFDIDEDFTLSDESFSEEDIPKENFIIFSNPLFDLDEEIASTKVDRINDEVLEGIHSIPPGIDSFDAESDLVESVLNRDISIDSSPKIDSLSNEFAGELILPKSIPPEIEEVEFDPEGDILFLESLLYDNSSPRPPEALQANSNAIESLPPSHIPVADNDSLMEEIDLFLADDGSIPPGIESDDVDSVDDDTSISLPEFESFYVDYPNSGNSTIDVVEDIPVDVPNVLPTHPILEQDFIPTSQF